MIFYICGPTCDDDALQKLQNIQARLRGLPNVEVLHVDILVGSGLPLTPEEKTFFCRSLCSQEKVKGSRLLRMLQYNRN